MISRRVAGVTIPGGGVYALRAVFVRFDQLPWRCRKLVIGTGTGALPVMDEVRQEARRRRVELVVLPTAEAIEALKEEAGETNAILHVTC